MVIYTSQTGFKLLPRNKCPETCHSQNSRITYMFHNESFVLIIERGPCALHNAVMCINVHTAQAQNIALYKVRVYKLSYFLHNI